MATSPPFLFDGTDAIQWATYVFLPEFYPQIVFVVLALAIPMWEHAAGMTVEIRIWHRLLRRDRAAPRLLRPMAICVLLLRYLTLIFTVLWALAYVASGFTAARCRLLWPLCVACSTALSWCSAAVLTFRTTAYFAPAIQSKATFLALRIVLWFMLAVMLAACIASWTLTDDVAFTSVINGRCTNEAVRIYSPSHPEASRTVSDLLSRRSMLLLNFACLLLHDCMITVTACWIFYRIKKQLAHGKAIISMLLMNTASYFIQTTSCAIFCIVWFVKRDPNVGLFNLYTSVSAILVIRMLSSEFLYTEHGSCFLSRIEQTGAISLHGRNGVGAGGLLDAIFLKGRRAKAYVPDGSGVGEMQGTAAADAEQQQQQHRRTGGRRRFGRDLTDIEAVSVYPLGRSRERPDPVWPDDVLPVVSLHSPDAAVSRDKEPEHIDQS